MITLPELIRSMREAISNITLPDLNPDDLPPVPDLNNFQAPPVLAGNNCNGNDKAIHLDIDDTDDLVIIICTFLEYEIIGDLSAGDLLRDFSESIDLELDSSYALKGALSTGIKITVSLTELSMPVIELDPIIMQLYMQSEVLGSVGLGLAAASVTGDLSLNGEFKLMYCSDCDGGIDGRWIRESK